MKSRSYPYLAQALVVVAGFVVVSTYAWNQSTANAIDFGVAIALTVLGVATVAVGANRVQRQLAGLAAATAAAMVAVTAGVFSGGTQADLTFAFALGIIGFATIGQIAALRDEGAGAEVRPIAEANAA